MVKITHRERGFRLADQTRWRAGMGRLCHSTDVTTEQLVRTDGEPTPVFFLAEGTGLSAEALGNSILQQFPSVSFVRHKFPFIGDAAEASRVIAIVDAARTETVTPLVFSTCAVEEIRSVIARCHAVVIDLFGAHLDLVERTLHVNATRAAGSAHGIGDPRTYDDRMQAVEYAMEHDDGQSLRRLDRAQVILTAPSRCGKTPTSMYLALQHGIFVANYPLVDEDFAASDLPEPLRGCRSRCFGLLTTPARLSQVRSERRPHSAYASLQQCTRELRRAEELFRRYDIPYLSSAAMSVEEMSAVIMKRLQLDRLS